MATIQNIVTEKGRAYMEKCLANGLVFRVTRGEVGTGFLEEGTDLNQLPGLIGYKAPAILRGSSYRDEKITFGVQFINTGVTSFFKVTEIALYAQDSDEGEIKVFHTYFGEYGEPVLPESENLVIRNFDLRYDLSQGVQVTTQISPEGVVTEREVSQAPGAGAIPRADHQGKIHYDTLGDAASLQGKVAAYFAPASHHHDNATTQENGFMSGADKEKLEGLAAQVTQNLTLDSSPTFKSATIGGVSVPDGLAKAGHVYANATTTQNGFMSGADKEAHNTLVSRVNQGVKTTDSPTFKNITISGGIIYGAKYQG